MSQDPKDFLPPTELHSSSQNRSNRGAYLVGALSAFALLGVAFAGISIYQSSTRQSTNAIASPSESLPMTAAPSPSAEPTTAPAAPVPVATAQIAPPTTPTATDPTPAPTSTAPTAPTAPTPVAPAPVTSTTSYQTQGTENGTPFTVRVLELKRVSGDSVLLRLAVTNAGRQNIRFSFLNVTPNESIYIVDAQEQKKAYPLKDARGKALATDGLTLSSLEPEETIEIFAQFPAPAAATQRLSIYFPGASAPIADVPITQ